MSIESTISAMSAVVRAAEALFEGPGYLLVTGDPKNVGNKVNLLREALDALKSDADTSRSADEFMTALQGYVMAEASVNYHITAYKTLTVEGGVSLDEKKRIRDDKYANLEHRVSKLLRVPSGNDGVADQKPPNI